MVRPLYPPRTPPGKKAPPVKPKPLWQHPQLIAAVGLIAVLFVVFMLHMSNSNVINPEAQPGAGSSDGAFSFLQSSRYFSQKPADIQNRYNQELAKMGIATETGALTKKVEAANLRDERRIRAIQKYEASRETSERFVKEREDLRRRLNSPTSQQLKGAILALEDSDNLGIMKLESLLEEKLISRGAAREDLDVLVYAYDSLARVYERKNMPEKAKEAYVNVFKLMKKQAPDSQGPDWDSAISNVEQMIVRPRSN